METLSKPHILYALPRSRSTAILQSSIKNKKYFEPISPTGTFKLTDNNTNHKDWYDSITIDKWKMIESSMTNSDSISKILGLHLELGFAKNWFEHIQKNNSCEIFVVHRNLYDVCWSFLIALQIGWFKDSERKKEFFEIEKDHLDALLGHIVPYIRHFPRNAKIISWEKLPETYFNKSLNVTIKDQNTVTRRKDALNYHFVEQQIHNIVEVYNPLIEKKLSLLQWEK